MSAKAGFSGADTCAAKAGECNGAEATALRECCPTSCEVNPANRLRAVVTEATRTELLLQFTQLHGSLDGTPVVLTVTVPSCPMVHLSTTKTNAVAMVVGVAPTVFAVTKDHDLAYNVLHLEVLGMGFDRFEPKRNVLSYRVDDGCHPRARHQ